MLIFFTALYSNYLNIFVIYLVFEFYSHMKYFTSLFLLTIFLFSDGLCQSKESYNLFGFPLKIHFESPDYNGGIQNWSFDQDSSGVVYVANNDGLLEFNGNSWKKYIVPSCTKVRAIYINNENRIFVGGQGQIGYFQMTDNGLDFESLLPLLPENYQSVSEVWKIIEIDHSVFFNTESQLLVYNYKGFEVLQTPGFINRIFKLDHTLLAQFSSIGIYRYIKGQFELIKGSQFLPEIISVEKIDDIIYYFSRNGRIYTIQNEEINEIELDFEIGTLNHVLRLNSGDLAVATQNNGLFLVDKHFNYLQNFTKNRGISDRTVKFVYEDDFNNLWLALNNGIDYLQISLPFSILNEEIGIEGTGYNAISFKENYYLGTNNGLFKFTNSNFKNTQKPFEFVEGSEGQVYNLSKIEDDLILNHHRGAFQLDKGQMKLIQPIGSWKLIQNQSNDVVLGGDYTGISYYYKEGGIWRKGDPIPGFNESSRILEYENDTTLWMSHGNKGAYRFLFHSDNHYIKEIEHFGENKGFPSDFMISVYKLNNQLVFTSEKGIYTFNPDEKRFEESLFFNKWLGEKHVQEIENDKNGAIYYIQDLKMGSLHEKSFGEFEIESDIFNHINQFINDDLCNISILDHENIIIGAKEGFVLYKPLIKKERKNKLDVKIRSVEISPKNDSTITFFPTAIYDTELQKNNSIKFHYSSTYFDGFEDLTYSYRLLPLNKNWSVWNKSGEKEYPFLSPGKYTFEVKSKNIYGEISNISHFNFTILRPWYYTSLAIFLYVLFALFLIGFAMISQNIKHKEEKYIITEDKEKTIQSKNEEISSISEASRKEINKLQNEKLKTELNLKNDQLTTITMQLMQNNEYILDIKNKIQNSISSNYSKNELERIIKAIDQRLEDNDSWDQFAYHFDQVHGGYLQKLSSKNIKLSPREIKLASFLRMNMSSKEISKLMNVTIRSVELARYRLRKKLKLAHDQNLVEYLIDLDNE